jgi:glucose-1-phosphatase
MKISTENIEAIIFDLGGVLLNIDFTLTQNALEQLGMDKPENVFGKYAQKGFFDALDKGLIGEQQLFKHIKKYFKKNISDIKIREAWNAMILDFPKHRIDLLLQLKKKYKVFLLSNTNIIHYDLYAKQLQESYGLTFDDLFHKAYLSFECGMRKPNAVFFNKVIEEQGLYPPKSIFFDDTEMHIATAIGLNIHAVHVTENTDVCDFF